ncbi:43392_t:CDS:2 [Gigaspora margarita]|uniref:43392_t:CDS:1 n=1 Tax=Gigaspora margarita TaxID=4874 RepID=A0ABN7V3B4_GIGMA|nr:43392_t:CDS:2 [Gigaspora margarita]
MRLMRFREMEKGAEIVNNNVKGHMNNDRKYSKNVWNQPGVKRKLKVNLIRQENTNMDERTKIKYKAVEDSNLKRRNNLEMGCDESVDISKKRTFEGNQKSAESKIHVGAVVIMKALFDIIMQIDAIMKDLLESLMKSEYEGNNANNENDEHILTAQKAESDLVSTGNTEPREPAKPTDKDISGHDDSSNRGFNVIDMQQYMDQQFDTINRRFEQLEQANVNGSKVNNNLSNTVQMASVQHTPIQNHEATRNTNMGNNEDRTEVQSDLEEISIYRLYRTSIRAIVQGLSNQKAIETKWRKTETKTLHGQKTLGTATGPTSGTIEDNNALDKQGESYIRTIIAEGTCDKRAPTPSTEELEFH